MVDHLNLAIDIYLYDDSGELKDEIKVLVVHELARRSIAGAWYGYQQTELSMIMMLSTPSPVWSLLITADKMPISMRRLEKAQGHEGWVILVPTSDICARFITAIRISP